MHINLQIWKKYLYERTGDCILNRSELNKCRDTSIMSCHPDSLIDLREVKIDTTKSVRERIDSFMNQVRNPYLFKVDDVIVKVKFGNERPVIDAIAAALQQG